MQKIDLSVQEIIKSKWVVALTGAGISAESGIPTFRGKGGLWEKYPPSLFGNIPALTATFFLNPQKVVNFFTEIGEILTSACPNPGHLALAELERRGILKAVITQNIDNLHQEAGNKRVIEVHGNAYRWRCSSCGGKYFLEKKDLRRMIEEIQGERTSRLGLIRKIKSFIPPCECGGRRRLDVVFFGEFLPQKEINKAYRQLDRCDLLLLIGTSGMVNPAATLPSFAKERGAKIIEVNPSPSSLTHLSDYFLRGKAGEVIPQLLNTIKEIEEAK